MFIFKIRISFVILSVWLSWYEELSHKGMVMHSVVSKTLSLHFDVTLFLLITWYLSIFDVLLESITVQGINRSLTQVCWPFWISHCLYYKQCLLQTSFSPDLIAHLEFGFSIHLVNTRPGIKNVCQRPWRLMSNVRFVFKSPSEKSFDSIRSFTMTQCFSLLS